MEFDCLTCGACCVFGSGDTRVKLTNEDLARLTKEEKEIYIRKEWYTAATDGRCNALAGTVGEKVYCKIYERRPINCAEYKAGSRHCLEARDHEKILEQLKELGFCPACKQRLSMACVVLGQCSKCGEDLTKDNGSGIPWDNAE